MKSKWGTLTLEILTFGIFLAVNIFTYNQNFNESINLGGMRSSYAEVSEEGLYIDESYAESFNEQPIVFYGPYKYNEELDENRLCVSIPKGSYTVTVEYSCDENQSIKLYSEEKTNASLVATDICLDSQKQRIEKNIELKRNVDEIELDIIFSGAGALSITGIKIDSNYLALNRNIIILTIAFLFAVLITVRKERISQIRREIAIVLFIGILSSVPIFMEGLIQGHDRQFHLLRIEAIMAGLLDGVFPVKLDGLFYEGYGYPASIYYNDIFLYFPALLRIIGISVEKAYEAYVVLMNIIAAAISYICFYRISKDKKIAFVTSLVYCTATYKLSDIYVRAAVGEYTAMVFLPLIILALFYIYDINERNNYARNGLVLALGMSGVIGSHILTTELVVLMLLVIFILMLYKTNFLSTIKNYLSAVGISILLNAYFLVPFLDYYFNCNVNINETITNSRAYINPNNMVNIQKLFDFQKDSFSKTPGIIMIIVLLGSIALALAGKKSIYTIRLIIVTVISLLLASDATPWNGLANSSKIWRMLSQIQFPFRFITLSCILLAALMVDMMVIIKKNYNQYLSVIAVAVSIVSILLTCNYSNMVMTDMGSYHVYNTDDLDLNAVGDGEYRLVGSQRELFKENNYVKIDGDAVIDNIKRSNNIFELDVATNSKGATITFPIQNYKGYQIIDDLGRKYEVLNGDNNCVAVYIPENFTGELMVEFVEPWYWRLSELISLFAFVTLIILGRMGVIRDNVREFYKVRFLPNKVTAFSRRRNTGDGANL